MEPRPSNPTPTLIDAARTAFDAYAHSNLEYVNFELLGAMRALRAAVDAYDRATDPDGYDPREGMGRGEVLDTYNGRITELCQ